MKDTTDIKVLRSDREIATLLKCGETQLESRDIPNTAKGTVW